MLQVNIDPKDAMKNLNEISKDDIPRALSAWIEKALITIQREAKKEVPRDTGILARWIRYRQTWRSRWEVFDNVSYAWFVHEWTRSHTITAKWWWLYWSWARHPVKSVRHPGTKANPFFVRAIKNKEDKLLSLLASTIDSFISK